MTFALSFANRSVRNKDPRVIVLALKDVAPLFCELCGNQAHTQRTVDSVLVQLPNVLARRQRRRAASSISVVRLGHYYCAATHTHTERGDAPRGVGCASARAQAVPATLPQRRGPLASADISRWRRELLARCAPRTQPSKSARASCRFSLVLLLVFFVVLVSRCACSDRIRARDPRPGTRRRFRLSASSADDADGSAEMSRPASGGDRCRVR